MADDSDILLVLAARGGDKDAFGVLLHRHRPLLLAVCRRTLGDPLMAEDAAQEAALAALLSLDRLRDPQRFGAWLCGIGLNICRNWLRDRTHDYWSWEAMLGGSKVDEPIDWRSGPEEHAETIELTRRVRQAVEGLPHGQRAAIMLFYLSGLTYAETAALLAIEVGTVKTRLHKARSKLRQELWSVWKENNMAGEDQTNLVEMRIADIRSLPAQEDRGERYCVVLEEVRGTTQLQIWIGSTEGTALAVALEKVELPRPMTYGLTSNLLRAVSTLVSEVRISKLVDDITYYAEILLEGPGGRVAVDARPSDALNLALLFGATIRVNAGVLEQAGQSNLSATPQFRSTWYAEGSKGAAEIAAEITNNWYGPGRSLSQGPPRPTPPEGH